MREMKKRKISLAIFLLFFLLFGGMKVQAASIQTEEGLKVKVTKGGSWKENEAFVSQIAVTIKNTKKKEISGWKISFQVPKDTEVSQCWGGNFKKNGNKIVITGVDYTKTIPSKGQVELGGILKGKKTLKMTKLNVYIKGKKTTSTAQTASKVKNTSDAAKTAASTAKNTSDAANKAKNTSSTVKTAVQYSKKNTPVKLHGRLKVKGTRIVDKKGKTIQLKGVSTHGVAWFPQYVNKKAFQTLRDKWGVNTIRLAMYSDPSCGYGKDSIKLVEKGVKYATDLGMYVIIDWHILSDGNPNTYKDKAKDFFKEMAQEYKNQNNIIYEICNEPNGGVTWENDIKPYALELIQTIRGIDKDAVIIVGTPNWSQDVDIVADAPITGEKNIMYALHFYAATHKEDLRSKAQQALEKGLPLFVSEFSICEASGNGSLDYDSADAWAAFCKDNNISMMAWNLSNKAEASSLLQPSCDKVNNYQKSDLSDSGLWFKNLK